MTTRRYLIAGNWKMNMAPAEAKELAAAVVAEVGTNASVDVAVCPPFVSLGATAEAVSGSRVALGAQNLYPKDSGAYTGEVSAPMLVACGCAYVILGHSERRQYFAETDAFVNDKAKAALAASLRPIVCVGETLEEREAGRTLEVVETQIRDGLAGLGTEVSPELVIAYEPVWAIGTGRTATPEMAQEVHAMIRKLLVGQFGEEGGAAIRVLYGGSMKPDNASELLNQPDIDGGLIGGASLKADSFGELVSIASSKVQA